MDVYPVPIRVIVTFVIALHIIFLSWLLWFAPTLPVPVKPKSFAVQTVQLNPRQQTFTVEPAKIEPKQVPITAPKPAPIPAKPATTKQTPPPKPTPKPVVKSPPKPPPKPVAKSQPKEIAQAEPPPKKGPSKESIDALKKKLAAIPNATASNGSLNKVSSSNNSFASADLAFGYEDELVSRLKILLKLPEMGDVKVALTLNRQGKVIKTEILSSANPTNLKAVETHLPAIQFPPFGKAYSGETTHTFTLTLTNL